MATTQPKNEEQAKRLVTQKADEEEAVKNKFEMWKNSRPSIVDEYRTILLAVASDRPAELVCDQIGDAI